MSYQGVIVGFGNIAQSTHVPALALAGLHVTAVVESQPSCQDAVRRLLPQARLYTSMVDMLAHETPDFVDICTPPHVHFDIACLAMTRGIHVLCEKPLVITSAEGEHLAQLAALHDVVLACVHNWAQAPILRRAGEMVAEDRIGALRRVEFVTLRTQPAGVAGGTNWRVDPRRAGGGILFDHGWHGMSVLLRWIASPPRWVRGWVTTRRHVSLAVEDSVESWVEFANGARAKVEATWAAQERANRAVLHGERGRILIDNDVLTVQLEQGAQHTEKFAESLAEGGYRPGWTAEVMREFAAAIHEQTCRARLLEEALTALRLTACTYESAARGNVEVPLY